MPGFLKNDYVHYKSGEFRTLVKNGTVQLAKNILLNPASNWTVCLMEVFYSAPIFSFKDTENPIISISTRPFTFISFGSYAPVKHISESRNIVDIFKKMKMKRFFPTNLSIVNKNSFLIMQCAKTIRAVQFYGYTADFLRVEVGKPFFSHDKICSIDSLENRDFFAEHVLVQIVDYSRTKIHFEEVHEITAKDLNFLSLTDLIHSLNSLCRQYTYNTDIFSFF